MKYDEVAHFMLERLIEEKYLYQETIVYEIIDKFGKDYTYQNENGNVAIDRRVLAAFRKITGDKIIWERGSRLWRGREEYDSLGRQQD